MSVTIASAMDRAARECSIAPPSAWIGATQLTYQELRDDFLLEVVDELLDRIDWPSPIGKVQTITGDGSEEYSLNSDFKRLARDPWAVFETTTTRRAGIPITSDGDWNYLKEIGTAASNRYYRLEGYYGARTIDFYQAPESSDEIKISYVSDLWMATSGGTVGNAWTDEGDILLLPRRLLELGVITRFRRRKGMPYADWLAEYETRVSRYANDRRQLRKFDAGDKGEERGPFDLVVPDFIPSS